MKLGCETSEEFKTYMIGLCLSCQVGVDWTVLPPGVRFNPSDEELLEHLLAKVGGCGSAKEHPLIDDFIMTLDEEDGICRTHPENLPGKNIRMFLHLQLIHPRPLNLDQSSAKFGANLLALFVLFFLTSLNLLFLVKSDSRSSLVCRCALTASSSLFSSWGFEQGWKRMGVLVITSIGLQWLTLQERESAAKFKLNMASKETCPVGVKKFAGTRLARPVLFYRLGFFISVKISWMNNIIRIFLGDCGIWCLSDWCFLWGCCFQLWVLFTSP